MTLEEKANAYDKVANEVREFFECKRKMPSDVTQTLEHLFPELKESEDDRIRKALISYFKSHLTSSTEIDKEHWEGMVIKDILAWLEKQGEQKPTIIDFKAKNWYVSKVDGKIYDMTYNLEDKSKPFDEYEGLNDFERTLADICIGWIGEEIGWKEYIKDNADALLKIAIKKFNANRVWTKEDESYLGRAIDALKNDYPMTATWLKSIKERILYQSNWKPSDEQIKAIRLARSFVSDDFGEQPTLSEKLMELEEQLQKLKK